MISTGNSLCIVTLAQKSHLNTPFIIILKQEDVECKGLLLLTVSLRVAHPMQKVFRTRAASLRLILLGFLRLVGGSLGRSDTSDWSTLPQFAWHPGLLGHHAICSVLVCVLSTGGF